jgi:hypothetical protein
MSCRRRLIAAPNPPIPPVTNATGLLDMVFSSEMDSNRRGNARMNRIAARATAIDQFKQRRLRALDLHQPVTHMCERASQSVRFARTISLDLHQLPNRDSS